MGLTMPRSIHCATLRLNINDVRWKDPRIAPQLFLCPARFRLSFALRTAERSTDQLTPPRRSLSFPYYRHLSPPERPMKIEVVVDPSRLAPTPSLASRVAPAENTAVVTNGTQAARSRGVPPRGRGRRLGTRKVERPQKTVEDLDAEMEDYTASNAAPAAAAAA